MSLGFVCANAGDVRAIARAAMPNWATSSERNSGSRASAMVRLGMRQHVSVARRDRLEPASGGTTRPHALGLKGDGRRAIPSTRLSCGALMRWHSGFCGLKVWKGSGRRGRCDAAGVMRDATRSGETRPRRFHAALRDLFFDAIHRCRLGDSQSNLIVKAKRHADLRGSSGHRWAAPSGDMCRLPVVSRVNLGRSARLSRWINRLRRL